MRIVNTTGVASDTRIFDNDGNDLTDKLQLTEIRIQAGDENRLVMIAIGWSVDVVADLIESRPVTPKGL